MTEFSEVWGFFSDMVKDAPTEFVSCKVIWDEGVISVEWLVANFLTMWGKVLGNCTKNMFQIGSYATSTVSAFVEKDYFLAGKDASSIIVAIFA